MQIFWSKTVFHCLKMKDGHCDTKFDCFFGVFFCCFFQPLNNHRLYQNGKYVLSFYQTSQCLHKISFNQLKLLKFSGTTYMYVGNMLYKFQLITFIFIKKINKDLFWGIKFYYVKETNIIFFLFINKYQSLRPEKDNWLIPYTWISYFNWC